MVEVKNYIELEVKSGLLGKTSKHTLWPNIVLDHNFYDIQYLTTHAAPFDIEKMGQRLKKLKEQQQDKEDASFSGSINKDTRTKEEILAEIREIEQEMLRRNEERKEFTDVMSSRMHDSSRIKNKEDYIVLRKKFANLLVGRYMPDPKNDPYSADYVHKDVRAFLKKDIFARLFMFLVNSQVYNALYLIVQ